MSFMVRRPGGAVSTLGMEFTVIDAVAMSLSPPVIVAVTGIVAMTALLLLRAALESARELRNPRRFWLWFGVACVAIAVLGLLGLELPREG